MTENCTASRTRRRRRRAALAGEALIAAAVVGLGVAHLDGAAPVHPLSALLHLLTAASPTGPDAFTIGPYTFDPFTDLDCSYCAEDRIDPFGVSGFSIPTETSEGWTTFSPIGSAAPLFELGGGTDSGIPLAPQFLAVFNSSGTVVGVIDVSNVMATVIGNPNLEMTIVGSWLPDGAPISELPSGAVYDIFNLNLPIPDFPPLANVYVANPGMSPTVQDFIVTSSGAQNVDASVVLPNNFGTLDLQNLLNVNAAATMAPGDAFTGLQTTADSSISADAFTIGAFTFNPILSSGAVGYNTIDFLGGAPPLLDLGGGIIDGSSLLTQEFDVYSGTTEVGSIDTNEIVATFLGMTSTEFTVTSATPASGETTADLPAVGTVYDVFNVSPLGIGDDEIVYIATPTSATETLVTPTGDIPLPVPFNAAIGPDMGTALAALSANQPYDSVISPLAFTIDGLTFAPESSTGALATAFNAVPITVTAPALVPLDLQIGGGYADGFTLASQEFFVYEGSGSTATNIGSLNSIVTVTNLLGFTSTEFTVSSTTEASGATTAPPAVGTVYDVFKLAPDIVNVYSATPTGDVADTLITPLGPLFDVNLLIPGIDAAAPLNPGDAIPSGLDVASAAASVLGALLPF
ncbi:hypothetical protein [Mycobacterium botniense]|uniref:Uncharacterized protein n=1 Tax=Mycobacterium botniense TaxID=84962 RepID=A0A7I9XUR0_9MYCO|nr:hypothetical protein [Mycobacterium botniense]GFG73558.1 hypothetical protein MBOT_09230 [Mycobacterium botniense]